MRVEIFLYFIRTGFRASDPGFSYVCDVLLKNFQNFPGALFNTNKVLQFVFLKNQYGFNE